MAEQLGSLVRLAGISASKLPPGFYTPDTASSALRESSPNESSLSSFITSILGEAIPFIDGVAPKTGASPTWKIRGTPKKYASSEAIVPLYERVVPGKDLDRVQGMDPLSADHKDETWFCRRSCHRNAAEKGTASWKEFTHAFRDEHPKTEKAFTPTVLSATIALEWDAKGLQVDAYRGRWKVESLKVVEMTHKIDPKPLKNRTFPVLQLSASLLDTDEFMVISIPLSDFEKHEHSRDAKDKKLVVAAYVSIERIRILPAASMGGKAGEIEWIMATASDAKGVLPQWMQNVAVPGQVAHDVDMFLKWIPSQRTKSAAV